LATAEVSQHGPQVADIIANKYRLESIIGTGGMGVVFAATQIELDRLVAVKVVRSELAENPAAVQRLVLEAKLAAQFRSEHVCKVLDVGTLPSGAPYIVMEYLEGSDLSTQLELLGPFAIANAVDFVLEACEALAEAHAAGIVHRDLKPENLFVASLMDGSPTIKVLDFGISKRLGHPITDLSLTNPSAQLGSPFYMAPEQMRAARDVDARADVWAIGAILYELVTGYQAFQGESLPEVCAAVLGAVPIRASVLRPEVTEPLADALDRCLRKDPGERFASVAELAAALAPFGSPRAQASLKRIDRFLSAVSPATLDRNLRISNIERIVKGGSRRVPAPAVIPLSGAVTGVRLAPGNADAQPTLIADPTSTTGASSAAVPTVQRRRIAWPAILVGGVIALSAAAVLAVKLKNFASRGAAPSALAAPAATPASHGAEPAPPPAAHAPAAAVETSSPAPPEAPMLTKAPSPAARHARARPASSAEGPPHTTPAAPRSARTAANKSAAGSSQPAGGNSANPAAPWDLNSFGPRR